MSSHDPKVTLRQIVDFASRAQELCSDKSLDEFLKDRVCILALERALELVGEAVNRLPTELQDKNPQVPWKLIIGMRNRLIHGYDDIRYDVLWDSVQKNIPDLITQ
jgi:uncharacterized protein with HEPN domain